MSWTTEILEQFAKSPICDYSTSASGASEPSCLAGLACAGFKQRDPAITVADYLIDLQSLQTTGAIGARRDQAEPRWTTSLAILLWEAVDAAKYQANLHAAMRWSLGTFGQRIERNPDSGHNSMLSAWPWVEGTHSWMEPSALFTVAFKSRGLHYHSRTREAVDLLRDRLLPDGGCNYGNTTVLGQLLRPHVQASGVVLLALAGEEDPDQRIAKTIAYLRKECEHELTPNSLSWALLGLAAHGKSPQNAPELLEAAYQHCRRRDGSPYTLSLLLNASLAEECLLITLPKAGKTKK